MTVVRTGTRYVAPAWASKVRGQAKANLQAAVQESMHKSRERLRHIFNCFFVVRKE